MPSTSGFPGNRDSAWRGLFSNDRRNNGADVRRAGQRGFTQRRAQEGKDRDAQVRLLIRTVIAKAQEAEQALKEPLL